MYINKIKLQNFRNYNEQEINLNKSINVFYGDNAQGKTNILEAIFLCTFGKSFRTNKEKELIKLGKDNANVIIEYEKKDRDGKISISISDKKQILVNGIKIKKLSELLGNINIVIFTPDDINILKGGPALRRRFLDMMIGQLKPNYVYTLNMYIKTLEQRNNYLRQIKEENKPENLLDIWDEKLIEYADIIYKYRKEFIDKIKKKINIIHKKITDEKEEINIQYISNCESKEVYSELLKQRRKLDIIKGFTTKGIHRDDFEIYINNKELSIYGSQGQNRTAILSLKLSELQVIYDEIEEEPILLLDDFMSELDINRRKNFLNNINNTQVIITCAEKIEFLKENVDYCLYQVKEGEII
ncbi:MAG TPA: DNA replication/repair protein RecF [Clostridiales bacterium]|jgi:DNA replication and repair protein recF|nr:DNA replication/repair protein RecF [Clostridiales bacterium]